MAKRRGRPPNTPTRIELRAERRRLRTLIRLYGGIDNRWVKGQVDACIRRITALEAADRAERSAE